MEEKKEKVVIGYNYEGQPITRSTSEIASCCCIICDTCGKLLDPQGGPKKVLCKECANKKNIFQKEGMLI
ncbi:hypothetical protein [Clostridium formicaceticum]|uniref:Uncharacterized protein n=1 Tax=Clostridium formicaceticum TaxID=1497 RepID=A0AAC9RJ31_9CLOT|nr:hypothetical protein [Clostridium formicaceticum]AOY77464.1 hypothetical protein BJL90_17350 [Clostridium formicaceticum]ARE88026.1 hypothetical protein CLFO_24270 [Clostridium formicaceticum]